MKLLRNIIRKLILEGIKADEMSELAIVKIDMSVDPKGERSAGSIPGDKYFLVHPEFFQQIRRHRSRGQAGIYKLAADKHIFGTMTVSRVPRSKIGNCGGATGIVKLSAARPGWGPTMYDIVMADNEGGIIADRYSVSDHAYNVWEYYLHNRTDGVHTEPLDWKARPWTKDTADDCSWGSGGDWGVPEDFPMESKSTVSWNELMLNTQSGAPEIEYPEMEYIKRSDWLEDATNYVYHDAGGPIDVGMVKSAIQKGDQLFKDLLSERIYLSDDWWETLEYEFYKRQQKLRY